MSLNNQPIFLDYFPKKTDGYLKVCLIVIIKTVSYVHYILNHAPVTYNVIWYIRSHITCQTKYVIYFLKCSSCNYSTTYTSKTVDLRSRMNNHITSYRLGGSTDRFDNQEFYWIQNQKQEPFFQILMFMKLADKHNLLFYEKLLQNRGYDTLNKP